MTNYIERARKLARAVAAGGATDLTIAIFRVYLAAAGASVRGTWVYIPGRATPLKGFRAAAEYVARLADTAVFLGDIANAMDHVDREVAPPVAGAPPAVGTDDLGEVAKYVAELASQIAALAATPPTPPADPETISVPADADLPDLLRADDRLLDRIVKRSIYTAGVTLLAVLDSWVETGRDNHESMGSREPFDEQFHAEDIRAMINDGMRELGAPEPYRRPAP
jgi:hypothetical protein